MTYSASGQVVGRACVTSLNSFKIIASRRNSKRTSKIKFTVHQSSSEVNFLDVCIRLMEGKLTTTVYSKPTHSHLYLNTKSNHPSHVVKNIPKSQFMRLRRICSESGDFLIQSEKYMKYFINRGYEEGKLKSTIREVSQMKREELLDDQRKKKDQNRVIFACNWHPSLSQLPQVLRKHFYILQNDARLKQIFKEVPLVAFRRAKTVRNTVVRSDIRETSPNKTHGTAPCSKKCKKTCHLIYESLTIANNKTGRVVKLEDACDCNTKDIVYAARCKVCDLIYIGESQDPLRIRFSKHRYDAKSRPDNCDLAKHFFDKKHDFEKDLEITVLKQGSNRHKNGNSTKINTSAYSELLVRTMGSTTWGNWDPTQRRCTRCTMTFWEAIMSSHQRHHNNSNVSQRASAGGLARAG